MKDYEIIEAHMENQNIILVLIRTCESPFDYLLEISDDLIELEYSGIVIFDELLHSGNNDERFIKCTFEDESFVMETFEFLLVKKQDELRKYICDYLRNDQEYLQSSGLTSSQIKLIEKNFVL